MGKRSSVLVVERSGEVREVLRTALTRRGVDIYEAAHVDFGVELARRHHPDLLVLDLDEQSPEAGDLSGKLADLSDTECPSVILLGSMRFPHLKGETFISKPYHYPSLV